MRKIVPAMLLLALLGGCATIRKGLGDYQAAADKGINIGGPPVDGTSGSAPEPAGKGRADLPSGLGGDKANAQYTSPQG